MLHVHGDHQDRGIARALLDHVETAARHRAIAKLHRDASIAARPLFERCGFRNMCAQTVTLRGRAFTDYRMEKRLDWRIPAGWRKSALKRRPNAG
jgi:putative acetyltransferase